MGFEAKQLRQLRSKLKPKHVRARIEDGITLHYVEGWHVIAEANRIFGFDGWDRQTIESTCVYTKHLGVRFEAVYIARVRITVKTNDGSSITREGSGTGEASTTSPGKAHELALKAAETDATKRALMTFGNAFGLSLYDPNNPLRHEIMPATEGDRASKAAAQPEEPRDITVADQNEGAAAEPENRAQIEIPTEAGRTNGHSQSSGSNGHTHTVGEDGDAPNGAIGHDGMTVTPSGDGSGGTPSKSNATPAGDPGAGTDTRPPAQNDTKSTDPEPSAKRQARIDKSALTLAEPKRHRDPEHLKYVVRHGCVICGRNRTHAHHLTFAQPHAMGRKVSDEYTVPLCAHHHQELHHAGNEEDWWKAHGVDPLFIADDLWERSRRDRVRVRERV